MKFLNLFAEKIDAGNLNIPEITANDVVKNGLNVAYYTIGSIAVVMIIIAGFTMVTSAGDAEAVKKAKNTITYSVIGLIFVILAFAITYFITGVFQ